MALDAESFDILLSTVQRFVRERLVPAEDHLEAHDEVPPELVEAIVESLGMRFLQWEDTTLKTLDWFAQNAEKAKQAGGPLLSPMIVMGETAKKKMENLRHSLGDSRLCTIQAVAQK